MTARAFFHRFAHLGLAGVGLWLAGCASHPFGLSDAEWQALPVEKRVELAEKQAAQDRLDAAVRAARDAQMEAARREEEAARQARRDALYANARYGDIVTLTLEGGGAWLGGKLCHFEPVSIDLIRGETAVLTLRRHDKTYVTTDLEVSLSDDANTVIVAPTEKHRFVAVNKGWDRGQSLPIAYIGRDENRPLIKDCVLTVRYKRLR